MADIELVIKMDEEDYKTLINMNNSNLPSVIARRNLYKALRDSTPLSKGHGRLIDVDELLTSERPKGIADDVWKESHIYKLLSNTPTIIKADKEN